MSARRPQTIADYWRGQARAAVTGLPCQCNAGSTIALHQHSQSASWGCHVCNSCHIVGPQFSSDEPQVFYSRDTRTVLVEADCLARAEQAEHDWLADRARGFEQAQAAVLRFQRSEAAA